MGLTDPFARLEFVEHPGVGRRFVHRDVVGFGDTDLAGRCRLDAVATMTEEAAIADWYDAVPEPEHVWIMRRLAMRVRRWPVIEDAVEMVTWSAGVGRRWADRRTVLTTPSGGHIDTSALWVCVDRASGRPSRLPPEFDVHYVESAGGRSVDSKLWIDPVVDAAAASVAWQTRAADFDVLEHLHNTVYWQMAEEVWATALAPTANDPSGVAPVDVIVEHRDPVGVGVPVALSATRDRWWCTGGAELAAVGVLRVGGG